MKLVYICSPYRATDGATLQRNIDYARELTRTVLMRGEAAVTPHLYMTQCLNEADEAERQCGLAAGIDIVRRCNVLVVGMRHGISEGMEKEIQCAKDGGMLIEYMDKQEDKDAD